MNNMKAPTKKGIGVLIFMFLCLSSLALYGMEAEIGLHGLIGDLSKGMEEDTARLWQESVQEALQKSMNIDIAEAAKLGELERALTQEVRTQLEALAADIKAGKADVSNIGERMNTLFEQAEPKFVADVKDLMRREDIGITPQAAGTLSQFKGLEGVVNQEKVTPAINVKPQGIKRFVRGVEPPLDTPLLMDQMPLEKARADYNIALSKKHFNPTKENIDRVQVTKKRYDQLQEEFEKSRSEKGKEVIRDLSDAQEAAVDPRADAVSGNGNALEAIKNKIQENEFVQKKFEGEQKTSEVNSLRNTYDDARSLYEEQKNILDSLQQASDIGQKKIDAESDPVKKAQLETQKAAIDSRIEQLMPEVKAAKEEYKTAYARYYKEGSWFEWATAKWKLWEAFKSKIVGMGDFLRGYWGPMRSPNRPVLRSSAKKTFAKTLMRADKPDQELPQNILSNLLQAHYSIDNPGQLPRYLVQYSTKPAKYYMVTPTQDVTKNALALPQMIIDYNYNPAQEPKDAGIGIVYYVIHSDGSTKALLGKQLRNYALAIARAYAGISVQADGSEKLLLPISEASLPMMLADPEGKKVPALRDTGIARTMTDAQNRLINVGFWYNVLTDSYLAKMTYPDASIFFIDVSTGVCYDWDGSSDVATVRLNRWPLYKGMVTGDYLFVGKDPFGLIKVAFKNPDSGKGYEPYTLQWIVDGIGQIIFGSVRTDQGSLDFNNFQGSQFVLANDTGVQKINLGYIYEDSVGNRLPSAQSNIQPFYAVWTRDDDNHFFFKDRYTLVPDINYCLLIYQQSRKPGQPMAEGTYVEDDNSHYICLEESSDLAAGNPFTIVAHDKPCSDTEIKTVVRNMQGIVFDKQGILKQLYYQRQLITLSGPEKTANGVRYTGLYTPLDQGASPRQLTITIQPYTFEGTSLSMPLISITDGQKIYDFSYDYQVFNTGLMQDYYKDINISVLMRDTWKLQVTPFVSNLQAKNTSRALVGSLAFGSKPAPISCPAGATDCDANALAQVLKTITVYTDTNQKTSYVPDGVPNKKFKRFLYKLGVNQWDNGTTYYPMTSAGTSFLNGYFVDLGTGILYYPEAARVGIYPVGSSLSPEQLAQLLDTLHLWVQLDADGYPSGLEYRAVSVPDNQAVASPS